jgi:hypothetical protein
MPRKVVLEYVTNESPWPATDSIFGDSPENPSGQRKNLLEGGRAATNGPKLVHATTRKPMARTWICKVLPQEADHVSGLESRTLQLLTMHKWTRLSKDTRGGAPRGFRNTEKACYHNELSILQSR